MRLTQLTDYAMRLLIYVAQHPQRVCTIREVAARYQLSQAHLMKITHRLGRAGWLTTTRGKGGGIRLARRPEEIGLGAVVRSMEPDFEIVECFATGSSCMLTGTCRLTAVMDGALRGFFEHLDRHTLADILPAPAGTPTQHVIGIEPPRAAAAR